MHDIAESNAAYWSEKTGTQRLNVHGRKAREGCGNRLSPCDRMRKSVAARRTRKTRLATGFSVQALRSARTVHGATRAAVGATHARAEERIGFGAAQEAVAVCVIAVEHRSADERLGFAARQETVAVDVETLERPRGRRDDYPASAAQAQR